MTSCRKIFRWPPVQKSLDYLLSQNLHLIYSPKISKTVPKSLHGLLSQNLYMTSCSKISIWPHIPKSLDYLLSQNLYMTSCSKISRLYPVPKSLNGLLSQNISIISFPKSLDELKSWIECKIIYTFSFTCFFRSFREYRRIAKI